MSVFRIREFFYARILTLIQVTFLCGVTIGILDPDWIFMLPSDRRHRFSTHASLTFLFGVGIREFSLDPQSVAFLLSGSAPLIHVDPLSFQQSKYNRLLTLLPCVIARDQGGGGGRRRQRR